MHRHCSLQRIAVMITLWWCKKLAAGVRCGTHQSRSQVLTGLGLLSRKYGSGLVPQGNERSAFVITYREVLKNPQSHRPDARSEAEDVGVLQFKEVKGGPGSGLDLALIAAFPAQANCRSITRSSPEQKERTHRRTFRLRRWTSL
jgi:hypothetical protein